MWPVPITYRFYIEPNQTQKQALAVQFGHARFVYNWGLAERKQVFEITGEGLRYTDTANRLKALKAEHAGLREADSQVLQQNLRGHLKRSRISQTRQTPSHEMNTGRIDHGIGGINPILIILAQTTVVAQPSEGTFYHPPPGNNLEPRLVRQPRRDFYVNPVSARLLNKVTRISAIGPQLFEPGKTFSQFRQQPGADRAIVVVCFTHKGLEDKAFGIHDHMPFASLDLFAPVVAACAPFSVVLTDWLSILPALGVACRPSFCRSCSRRLSLRRRHVPSFRQVLK